MRRPTRSLLVVCGVLTGLGAGACEVHTHGIGAPGDRPADPGPEGPDAALAFVDSGPGAPDAGGEAPLPEPADDAAVPPAPGDPLLGMRARVHETRFAGLNLRTGPATDHEVLAVVPEGCLVDVMGGPLDRWYEVAFGTHTGWVHGAYLERAADESDDPCTGYDLMLPWTAGESHPVARGHGTSPHRYDAEHAWDFSLPVGTVVRAAHSGVVRRANLGSLGSGCDERSVSDPSYVVVSRGDGSETLYLHLASIDVTEGQRVSRGQRIGASGRPGAGCEAYVHFQLQSTPSPSSSGSWWEPSVPASFHDGGSPYDPAEGSTPISANEPT